MIRILLFYLLLLLLLSAGCVFGAVRFGRRFEECLPLSMVGMVCCLFLFGLFGQLRLGFLALCALSLLLYAAALLHMRRRSGRAPLRRIFTPAALLFALSLAGLLWLNYGHLPFRIDEMTHWADTVKAMYCTGLLPCAAQAGTRFPTYPPGMALMEYCFLQLFDLAAGERVFAEWVMYAAYQSFLLAFFFPFLKTLELRRPLRALLSLGFVFLCPLMMDQSRPYSSLYIDPFMSVVFGCALAMLFGEPEKDGFYDAYLAACCVMLVLVKPAGLLLAVFLAVVYGLEYSLRQPDRRLCRRAWAAAAGSVLLPLGLWTLAKQLSHVQTAFSGKEGRIDPALLLQLALHRGGDSWQQSVHDEYYRRLFTDAVPIKGVSCPYWLLLLASALALYGLIADKSRREAALRPAKKLLLPSLLVLAAVYYIGLCYMYIFKFDRWEAVGLASLDRYIGIVLYAVYAAAVLCFVRRLQERPLKPAQLALAAALFILLAPFGRTLEVLQRTETRQSQLYFQNYRALASFLNEQSPEGGKRVWLVFQGDTGGGFYAFQYILRPHTTVEPGEWNFGPSPGPGLPEDHEPSAADWQRRLEGYDYVYLQRLDDYFLTRYSGLFAPDSPPEEGGIYRAGFGPLTRVGTAEGKFSP